MKNKYFNKNIYYKTGNVKTNYSRFQTIHREFNLNDEETLDFIADFLEKLNELDIGLFIEEI